MTNVSPGNLLNAVARLAPEVKNQLGPNSEFLSDERALWTELSCCVLSSQVPYEMAVAVARRVSEAEVLDNIDRGSFGRIESRLTDLLLEPVEVKGKLRRYRFPRMRAKQLAEAAQTVWERFGSLAGLAEESSNPESMRQWMVEDLPGFGPKQASMFLRNVGLSYDLAILDRHTVQFMVVTGLCSHRPVTTMN